MKGHGTVEKSRVRCTKHQALFLICSLLTVDVEVSIFVLPYQVQVAARVSARVWPLAPLKMAAWMLCKRHAERRVARH